jgi:hypothetical protein
MGLFGSIGNFLGTAAKAVATGGISLVAPKLIPKPVNTVLNAVTKAQFPTSLSAVAKTGLAVATKNPSLLLPSQGAPNMGLDLGGILSTVGNIFGGNQNPYFQGVSNVANLASQFVPQQTSLAARPLLPAAGGAVARAGAMVGRGFFNRFPNLATAIQQLRNRGMNVKRSQLYNMLKRFGPEVLVTGGLLTAAAVNELMVAGPGHRRMNPGNVHALRRSMRRLQSFHKLCVTADQLRRPRAKSKPCRTSGGTQFVRQG